MTATERLRSLGLACLLLGGNSYSYTPPADMSSFQSAKGLAAQSGADLDKITKLLRESLADGSFRYFDFKYGTDFDDIRAKVWSAVLSDLSVEAGWVGTFDAYVQRQEPLFSLVWRSEQWDRRAERLPPEVRTTFRQFAGSYYAFAGDYRSAELIYPADTRVRNPVELGYEELVPAADRIIAASQNRRLVLLNESHGRADTRASNFLLIRRLIDEGFTHLALEALNADSAGNGCDGTGNRANVVSERGRVSSTDGYYVNDPILAETVRYALSRGVKVFGYDIRKSNATPEQREQHQSDQISCVLEQSSSARVIVVGGFAHISERPGGPIPGGALGHRLALKLSLDPLTVESTILLKFDLVEELDSGGDGDPIYLVQNGTGKFLVLHPSPGKAARIFRKK